MGFVIKSGGDGNYEVEYNPAHRTVLFVDTKGRKAKILSPKDSGQFTFHGTKFLIRGKLIVPAIPQKSEELAGILSAVDGKPRTYLVPKGEKILEIRYKYVNGSIWMNTENGNVEVLGYPLEKGDDRVLNLLLNGTVVEVVPHANDHYTMTYDKRILSISKTGNGFNLSIHFEVTQFLSDNLTSIPFKYRFTLSRPPTAAYIESKVHNMGIIETPEGFKHVPVVPGELMFSDLHKTFVAAPNKKVIQSDSIVPNMIADVNGTRIYYSNHNNWKIMKDGIRAVAKDGIVYRRTSKRGTFKHTSASFKSVNEELHFDAVLRTGQKVLLARILGDRVRLYGIVTPGGIFSLEVPTKRLDGSTPISVFDEGVKVITSFVIFPVSVRFDTSAVNFDYETSRYYFTIDDNVFEYDNKPRNGGEFFRKVMGIERNMYSTVMHYGIL